MVYFYRMPSEFNLAHLLKEQTEKEHRLSEAALGEHLNDLRSREQYAAILKTFYGFFFPLQEKIRAYISPRDLKDILQRKNACLILTDLQNMGQAGPIMLTNHLPQINCIADAFGALYVLEGSTLGGKYIRKILLANPALDLTDNQTNFFNSYGEDTGKKWTTFLKVLNEQPDGDKIVQSAQSTFALFTSWINKSLKHA